MTEPAHPEEVDIEFNAWYNSAQPIQQILRAPEGPQRITGHLILAIRDELKQAFTHGYARGIAAEVARPPPDNEPNPGLTA